MNNLTAMKAYLEKVDSVIENGEYKDNWPSLVNHKVPDWYRKSKFGIFIHWGLYSLSGYGNEWYPRFMYQPDMTRAQTNENIHNFHVANYGALKDFGYKDFIPMFTAEKFDPKAWADIVESSGAKFVMPVAEHHDGFQMYDSEISSWNTVEMGPKKDVLGMVKDEMESRGLIFATSSHRAEHYWFMGGGRLIESDMPSKDEEIPYEDLYWPSKPDNSWYHHDLDTNIDELFMQDWLARTCELIDLYKPKMLYFDWWIQQMAMKPYLKKFAAYYYNRAKEWGEEVTINYKHDALMYSVGISDVERGKLADISPTIWQSDTSVAKNSWGYSANNDYKNSNDLIRDLIDIVSKNGVFLLNIGPKGDGSVPTEDAQILKEIGQWFSVNGEGIYDTTFWRKYGEGPTTVPTGFFSEGSSKPFTSEDFRFTFKDEYIYAFSLSWPQDGVVKIKSFAKKGQILITDILSVEVLGAKEPCEYYHCDEHLTVISKGMKTGAPVCIKIKIK